MRHTRYVTRRGLDGAAFVETRGSHAVKECINGNSCRYSEIEAKKDDGRRTQKLFWRFN